MRIMSTFTAFTEFPEVADNTHLGWGEHQIIDAAASVGKKYPVVIGHVTVIRGFGHFTGDHFSAFKGITAVIALSGANSMDNVLEALRTGLKDGRDDRS
jgi:hypothetical protein